MKTEEKSRKERAVPLVFKLYLYHLNMLDQMLWKESDPQQWYPSNDVKIAYHLIDKGPILQTLHSSISKILESYLV